MIRLFSGAQSDGDPSTAHSQPIDSLPTPSSLPPIEPGKSLQHALAAADEDWSEIPSSNTEPEMNAEQPEKETNEAADVNAPAAKENGEMGTPLQRPAEALAGAATTMTSATTGDKTQLVRGMQAMTRSDFKADPVVGWFVVIGGPGLGAFRPIFEGNNTVGRSNTQRVPIDFGDDAISAEEQCYVRYDSSERRFLFVPNLAKTNVVSVNEEKPTNAVPLQAMDVVTVGRTQLVFVPFCGDEFDWSELSDLKAD